MNRFKPTFALVALCVPVLAMAQTPVAPQAAPAVIGAAKIAWLNLQQAIFSCDEGKNEFSEVQKFVDSKNSELDALRKESEALRNQLNVQGSKLTDEARADLENQIDAKDTALQRFQQDTQKEIDSKRVRATNYIGKRMLPVIEKIAKEKGLSAVLIIDPNRDAWIDQSLIITEEVVNNYNQTYPTAGAAKTPASKP
jgi:Skp family chaperone for outer membrane proteins